MTGGQEITLMICAGCAVTTLVVHLIVKNGLAATLVALAMCVGGVAFEGWLERAESALWIVGTVVAGGLAAGVTLVVSVVCVLVRRGRGSTDKASTGNGGKRV